MMLTDEQLALIRASWAEAASNGALAADLFYGRLLRMAPETGALLQSDPGRTGRKLTDTLGFVVDRISQPDTLAEAARALAVHHLAYGVRPEHYAPVCEALIWTLEHMLGPRFTPQMREAWVAALDRLSKLMLNAAYPDLSALEMPA